MKPKKAAMKVTSYPCSKVEILSVFNNPCSVTIASDASKKKIEVIDLTIERSSDEEEDLPPKRSASLCQKHKAAQPKGFSCISHHPYRSKGTIVTSADSVLLTDYSGPFHHMPVSSMSSDFPGLDFLSLIPVDPQYCPPMFLGSLTSPLTPKKTVFTLVHPAAGVRQGS